MNTQNKLIKMFLMLWEQNKRIDYWLFPKHKIKNIATDSDNYHVFVLEITTPYSPYEKECYTTYNITIEEQFLNESVLDQIISELEYCESSLNEIDRLDKLRADTLKSLTDEQKMVLGLK